MDRRTMMVLACLAAAVAFGGTAYAAEGAGKGDTGVGMHMSGKKAGGKHFDQMAKELGLTAEQQEKIQAHKKNQQEKMKAINTQLRANREQMRGELEKPALDRARIDQLTQERKTLESARVDQQLAGVLEMREILTPEQYKKMTDSMAAKKKNHAMKAGKGKGMMKGEMKGDMDKPCADIDNCGPCE